MDRGDYCLAKWPKQCVIERKGSMRELQQNLSGKDFPRFCRAVEKLAECANPWFLLDIPPHEYLRPTEFVKNPSKVLDTLFQFVLRYDMNLWLAGNCKAVNARRQLGEQVVRLMITHAMGGTA